MIVEPKKIVLKDGRSCIIRNSCAADAQALLDYLKVTAGESEYLLRYPEEVKYTLEGEQEILESKRNDPRSIFLVAEVDGRLAGNCGVNPFGWQIKVSHRCSLAIALYKEFWGLGIGTALLRGVIDAARKMGYEQMELDVVSENVRGLALYTKMGFKKYGERPNGLKCKDGRYLAETQMYLSL